MTDWTPAQDSLPESGELVLCYSTDHMFVGFRNADGDWRMKDSISNTDRHNPDIFAEVTHWARLPNAPEEER